MRVGSLAAFGLGLPEFLRARASAEATGPDVSCILIWLLGGISHIDSFDPKPDAPAEIRGEFGVIDTNVPGVRVCDPLPTLAQHQDKFSILRSLNPRNGSHGMADAYMMTGHPFNQSITYPTFGSVVAKEKGDRNGCPPSSRSARTSTSGSAAASRGSWATSTTRSSCRATPRAPASRSATSRWPTAWTPTGSGAG